MKKHKEYLTELDTNNHSVFSLNYHLVLVIKYRRRVITRVMSEFLKINFHRLAAPYKVTLTDWGFEADHVHIVFKAEPDVDLSSFINAYKSASSRLVKKEFPEVREQLYKEAFWSKSYCLITSGGAPLDILRRYVEHQGGED